MADDLEDPIELKPFPSPPSGPVPIPYPNESDLGIGPVDQPLVSVDEDPTTLVAEEPSIELKPWPEDASTDASMDAPSTDDEGWFSE